MIGDVLRKSSTSVLHTSASFGASRSDLAQGIASPEDENDEPSTYEDSSLLDPGRCRRRRYLAPRTDAQAPSSSSVSNID